MRVILKAKKTSLSPAVRNYIENKIVSTCEKLIDDRSESAILEVEFGRSTDHHRKGNVWWAEANLAIGKKLIRASRSGEDPHGVIDLVADEIGREIKTFKTKRKTNEIRGARKIKRMMRKA